MPAHSGSIEQSVGDVRALLELEQCVAALIRDDAVPVPPYPAIVTKLIKLLRDADYRMDALVQLIGKDQAVAATLLRYANAAAWGPGSQVHTLQAAVVRLGAAVIQRIVLASTLGAENKLGGPLVVLRRRVWRDSILAAHIAEALARGRGLDPDEMFIAGLLHDIGKLAAISAFELAIERVGGPTIDEETWWSLVERHHVEMGATLAARWHLPKALATLIAGHHTRVSDNVQRASTTLIQAVDVVVELAEYHASLSLEQLADSPLSPQERRAVVDLLPQLAAAVAALENPSGSALASKVSVPDVAIGAPQREVDVEARIASPKVPNAVRVVRIGPRGLLAMPTQMLVAGQLHHLRIERHGEPVISMWATPHPIEGATNSHLLKPFVLDGLTQSRYLAWVRGA